MIHRLFRQVAAFMSGVFLLSGTFAIAAGFPDKPVRFLVGFSAGAGVDLDARGIAPFVQKHLGTQVIIENVPGANAKIALTKVWKGQPDGYSIIIHTTTMSIIGQYLLNPEYRIADFAHIYSWSITNQVLVVNSDVYKTFEEFLKDAKSRTLSAGLPGFGSASHVSGLMLANGLGIKVNWVPFDGSGDALVALAGKHIDMACIATTSALPLARAGKITPMVVLANEKDLVFPTVPLAKDLGYNFPVIPMLRGADAPPKTPLPVIKTLERAFAKAIREPGYISWAEKRMATIQSLDHEEYGKAILKQQTETEKFKQMLKPGK